MAHRGASALRSYIGSEQNANKVPPTSRVLLKTIKSAESPNGIAEGLSNALLVQGHSKMRPLVVFSAVLAMFLTLAYILENLRPRAAALAGNTEDTASSRRAA
jgi:hypothetical protein